MNPARKPAPARQARSVARLAAVQALYQMELTGLGVEAVVREFTDHRFAAPVEGETGDPTASEGVLADADEGFFAAIVRGVVEDQGAIDRAVVRRLAQGWKLDRLDATVRAILRAGAYELMHRPDVPVEVVINEYLELSKAFFDPTEAGFVNGALDSVARDVRPK